MHEKRERCSNASLPRKPRAAGISLSEIPLQQSLKALSVPGFVPGHFVDGVMDGVQAQLLGLLGQVGAALGGAVAPDGARG